MIDNIEIEIKEGNGKVKEYYNYYGELIFEGEYLNGERKKWKRKRILF